MLGIWGMKRMVLFSCIGASDYTDFEKWKDLDEQILQLANEVEGISSS